MNNKKPSLKDAIYKLKYKSMTIVSFDENETKIDVYAEIRGVAFTCVNCNHKNITRFGYVNEKILDKPLMGKRVVVHLKKQRSRCTDCGKTFLVGNNDKYGNHQVTKALEVYIKKASKKKTVSCIAKEIGIARSTIRELLDLK